MPRRKAKGSGFVRDVGEDMRHKSVLVQKLINVVMKRGKKSRACSIVYEAIDALIKKAGGDVEKGYALFEKAIQSARPAVEVRPRRVGGGIGLDG